MPRGQSALGSLVFHSHAVGNDVGVAFHAFKDQVRFASPLVHCMSDHAAFKSLDGCGRGVVDREAGIGEQLRVCRYHSLAVRHGLHRPKRRFEI